jgi:hypothetical protein
VSEAGFQNYWEDSNMKSNTDESTLYIPEVEGVEKKTAFAKNAIRPAVNAAMTTKVFAGFEKLDLTSLLEELTKQSEAVNKNDMTRSESMLISQAHTLDAIFNNLARRSAINIGNIEAADKYMRLALKAQGQCRATLQTLGEIKNPRPVAFVKQANISHGPQQVNNGVASSPDASHAQENQNQPNELLEELPSERLDARAPSATSGVDSSMETVGAFNRPS